MKGLEKITHNLLMVLFLMTLSIPVLSATITVGPDGSYDYQKIQDAIDSASDGDKIVVYPGTYVENINFGGKNIILCSTDPTSPPVVAKTVIDGNRAGSVVTFSGTELTSCILAGFTITKGSGEAGAGIFGMGTHATIQYNYIIDHIGGGIDDCDGLIQYNLIRYCQANRGGGLRLCDGIIEHNDIFNNWANNGGGLADCYGTIQYNTISQNSANNGAAFKGCSGLIQHNRISGNEVTGSGAGFDACTDCIIQNNLIFNNWADGDGAAIAWCKNSIIQNNIIYDNIALGYGGALAYCFEGTVVRNNIIYNNWAEIGGGLYWCYGKIVNNTIYGNVATQGGGLALCTDVILNCIIWHNSAFIEDQLFLCSVPFFSCIEDWPELGIGNISSDPLLTDPENRDFHLQPESPCIDAGGNAGTLIEDFEGDGRPLDAVSEPRGDGTDFDIGADEFGYRVKWSQPPNMVDGFDVTSWNTILTTGTIVADDWQSTPGLSITHIRWWGSYPGWLAHTTEKVPPPPIRPMAFLLSLSRYIPGETFSIPGETLFEEWCNVYSERWFGVVEDRVTTGQWEHEYVYECDLTTSWSLETSENYFLSIQAIYEEPPSFPWGWKNSTYHWNNDAVISYDGKYSWNELRWPYGHSLEGESMDMAFELWGPAPTPCATPYPTLTPTPTPSPTPTPTPTPIIKWRQPPNMVNGFDVEASKISETTGTLIADDWMNETDIDIQQVRWWGSYIGWQSNTPAEVSPPSIRPALFLIKLYQYIPGATYSIPGNVIYEEVCKEFTERWYGAVQDWVTTGVYEHEFVYECNLSTTWTLPVDQTYFLSIQAVYDQKPLYPWGWKNSENQWNAPAVVSIDNGTSWTELRWPPGHSLAGEPMDMAFELWSDIPPPGLTPTPTATPTPTPTPTPIIRFTFDTCYEGWQFAGYIPPYDMPTTCCEFGHLGLYPLGSMFCFSFWYSPDVQIVDGKLYRAKWLVGSSTSEADQTVQFRLRVNQKGSWQGWDRIVNSFNQQAPSDTESKWYDLFFNPQITGTADDIITLSFDIMSFDPGDDTNSWLYLEEVVVEEATITSTTEVLLYDFVDGLQGWQFAGAIPPYDEPLTEATGGHLGLSPNGSTNCFSYWYSPDLSIEDGKVYRAQFELSSDVTNSDDAVQFRLRVNQKGSWQSWDKVVNSYNHQAPSATEWKNYDVIFNPNVTGTTDNLSVFSFDIMSFDPADSTTSWLFLESLTLEEISISP